MTCPCGSTAGVPRDGASTTRPLQGSNDRLGKDGESAPVTGHTPEPWNVSYDALLDTYIVFTETGRVDRPKDARLIAKAPEMYDVLKALVEDHDPSECADKATPGFSCEPHMILREIDQ